MDDNISVIHNDDPSIRFVIPYFGAWPFWFPFFLQSCRYNSSVEWVFYTDCGIPDDSPENIRFVNITFKDYCSFVSDRLNIDFYPENPYKLCDIKPALGHIHEDDLIDCVFWAFGDIDVIYGDLRKYFTADRLADKDFFATHERRVSGHLCLVRNTKEMREAYRLIPRWQERYSDPIHQALDEGAFSRIFIKHKNWPEPLRRFAARFNRWYTRSEFVEAHSTFTALEDGSRHIPDAWYWQKGKLTNSFMKDREFPYFHFLVWKNDWKCLSAEKLGGPRALYESGAWKITCNGWAPLTEVSE